MRESGHAKEEAPHVQHRSEEGAGEEVADRPDASGEVQADPLKLNRADHRRFMRTERHRISGRGGNVLDKVGETIVLRRGYGFYQATKRRPWDLRNERRKANKTAAKSRAKNRSI